MDKEQQLQAKQKQQGVSLSAIGGWVLCALIALGSLATWGWAWTGGFGACVKGSTGSTLTNTVAVLQDTMDLGVKLSVTLVGAGAALLIGLKQGVQLHYSVKTLLLFAVLLFGQSALTAIFWKLRIANSWMNGCLNLVSEPFAQRMFEASFGFFLAGLVVSLAMVLASFFRT